MNYSKIQTAARLIMAGACFITAGTSWGAEFWLRTGTTNVTLPDGRQVVMWGFAQDSAAGAGDGVISVPGPQLNVAAGDSLTIHLQNTLPEPVSIVIPGQYSYDSLDPAFHAGGAYDGRVRSLAREAAPGGTATYAWTSVQPGTFLYHSGSHPSVQVQMGLYGALVAVVPGPQVYAGVAFSSAVTLLFSEIDPEVHDAVAGGGFGPGPAFLANDFTDAATGTFVAALQGSSDPVAQFLFDAVTNAAGGVPATAADLTAALNLVVGGSSIYTPDLFPDESILSEATLNLLIESPEINQPTETVPFNGTMVRLNRFLLQDGLANAGIAFPAVKTMTSTIRSYAQYFLVNGQPYTNGTPAIAAGNAGSTTLLRLLNAGMDAHVPTLNNGGDLQLVGEDGQQAPYIRNSAVVWMPALKTVDALWTPASAGTYAISDRRLGVVNAAQPGAGGMIAYLSVGAPAASTAPTILVQPASQSVPEFATATYTVIASGTGLTYQWYRGASAIPGATAASYSLANVSLATDNGALFHVVVTGTVAPAATSADATLTVTPAAPAITTQPASHNVTPPAATSFTVVATGSTPLTYLWYKGPTAGGPFAPLANGAHISGATSATLNLLAPTTPADAGFYQVVVTGPGGVATSAAAELRVAPAITVQPANVTVPDLATANFAVTATGSGLTYQWQRRPGAVGTFVNIAGATSSTYGFQVHYLADNGAQFRVLVSGTGGPTVTSGNATLTVTPVNSAPTISVQPSSLVLNSGTTAHFIVTAYGYPAPSYQWQRWNGTTWSNLVGNFATGFTGTTTSNLSAASITVARAGSFRVRVFNPSGSVTSLVATLTVNQTFAGLGTIIPAAGGTAFPYPSTSASVPAFTGSSVKDANVSINNLIHPEPYDLSGLLVTTGNAASARRVELFSGLGVIPAPYEVVTPAGSVSFVYSYGVTNVSLTFDDAAASPVSSLFRVMSGTYRPTVTLPVAAFPAPALGLPYATTLSSLNGFVQTTAGGWRLYVNDTSSDVPITGTGLILTWSLNLTVGP